jgi:putative transposase
MPNPVQALLVLFARATDRELAKQLQFVITENKILRARLPSRIYATPKERVQLLKHGKPLGSAIKQLVSIVAPETFARWVRESKNKPPQVRSGGRPRKRPALRKLILKIARETGWGYTRVLGEVRKLTNQKISRQSVANIMREADLDPGPKRGEKTWDEFVKIHAKSLWQCDFVTKRSLSLKGLRSFYLLVFLNVATRKVLVSKATAHSNRDWLTEQVEVFRKHVRKHKLPATIVIHDADPKLGKTFDSDLKRAGLSPKRLRPCSPNMNAFVERFIQSIQVECLDHFIVFGESHLNHLVAEYVARFESERPHQGLDNKLVVLGKPPKEDVPLLGQVKCYERLGGMLKHYERGAAQGVAAHRISIGRSTRCMLLALAFLHAMAKFGLHEIPQ